MTRILVDPDQLRSLSTRFEQISQDLRAVAGRANASWSNLDLIVRQKAAIGGQVSEAVNRGHALAREAMVKANYLLTKAQAFEEADGQGVGGVGQVFGAFTEWVQGAPSWWGFPSQQVNAWWNLGGVLGEQSPIRLLRLPAVAGIAVVGVASLSAMSQAFSEAMRDFAERLWNWLHHKGWKTNSEIQEEQRQQELHRQKEQRRQEELRRQEEQRRQEELHRQEEQRQQEELRRAKEELGSERNMTNPWKQVNAPIKNDSDHRSGVAYQSVIEQFDVEHSHTGRYRPSESYPDTRCNIFAGDAMRAMGAPLPTKGELGVGHGTSRTTDPMTANARDTNNWLNGEKNGWRRIDLSNSQDLAVLREHLQAGKPALVSDPGHVAVLRPDHLPDQLTKDNLGSLHIAQAGADNRNDIALGKAGYGGKFKPDFFIHE